MKRKFTALLLALVLALGCLTACGSTGESAGETPAPETESPEVTDSAAETGDSGEPDKFDLAFARYAPDAVVMTVNGVDVPWDYYYYWISNIARQKDQVYPGVSWSDALDATYTFQSYAQFYAESILSQYWVVDQKAAELGLTLDDEDREYIESIYASDVANYGGGDEEAFAQYLADNFITRELYDKMLEVSQLYAKMFEHYFGEAGADLSDEDAMAYASDSGYLHAKHILFMTLDAEGNPMSEEDKQNRLELAQQTLSELRAISDPEELNTRFDELMYDLSDDTGLPYYPDGYYFLPGEMVSEFETGTQELEEYAVSDVIESSYGYHIIQRLPLELDAAVDTSGYTLRYLAAAALFDNMCSEWFDSAEVQYSEEFAQLDFDELFAEE